MSPELALPKLVSVSFREFNASERTRGRALDYWNDLLSRSFSESIVDVAEPGLFAGQMKRAILGDMVFATPRQSSSVVRHTREHVAAARADNFFLVLQLCDVCVSQQLGRNATLEPGDFTLLSTADPYAVQVRDASQVLVVRLPGHKLRQLLPDAEDFVSVPVRSSRGGLAAVLVAHLTELWRQLEAGLLGAAPPEIIDALLQLICSSFLANRPPGHRSRRNSHRRREQLLSYVRSRIRDADLSVSGVADALGMSTRNVSKLMRQEGIGLAAFILRQRLDGAAQWLEDPRRAHLTVSQIAYGWGFNDLSHFSRAFRQRFGQPPGRHR